MRANRRALIFLSIIILSIGVWWFWRRESSSSVKTAESVAPTLSNLGMPKSAEPRTIVASIVPPAPKSSTTQSSTAPSKTTASKSGQSRDPATANPQDEIATAIPYFLGLLTSGDINEQLKVFSWPRMTPEHYTYSLEQLSGPNGPKLVETLVRELELIRERTPDYDNVNDTATWDFVSDGVKYHIVWFKYQGQWYFGSM